MSRKIIVHNYFPALDAGEFKEGEHPRGAGGEFTQGANAMQGVNTHPDYVYHGTTKENLEKIKKQGFKPGTYFATNPTTAHEESHYAAHGDPFAREGSLRAKGSGGEPVVVAIAKKLLEKQGFKIDQEYAGNEEDFGRALISQNKIPSKVIAKVLKSAEEIEEHTKAAGYES